MKILALPRDTNPYQRLFYGALAAYGVRVRYARELTPSRTLNLLLLPVELAVRRAWGWRVLHVHWVFAFALPGSDRHRLLRRLSQTWFTLVLFLARLVGLRIVWTAHNVLPHEPVFDDDRAARCALVRASDLVLAHSQATLEGLAALGARPRHGAVIPLASTATDIVSADPPRSDGGPLRLLFFGKILEYKGVEDLLAAAALVPVSLTVVGETPSAALATRLRTLADCTLSPVRLRLERVPERELGELIAASDAIVLPFRQVTTSTSVLHAMAYGRTVVIPDLEAFRDIPANAVVRYGGSVADLSRTLASLGGPDRERLREVGHRAREYTRGLSWELVAECAVTELRRLEVGKRDASRP